MDTSRIYCAAPNLHVDVVEAWAGGSVARTFFDQFIPRLVVGFGAVSLLSLAGCSNPCQQICNELAAYATECDLDVDTTGVDQCIDDYASAGDAELAQCAEWGDGEQLREWWTCDDLADRYQQGGGAPETE